MTKKKKQKYDTLGGESMHQSKKKKTKKTKTKVSKASQAFHTENLLKSPKGTNTKKKKRISNNNYNTVRSVDGDLDISPGHLLSGKHEGDDTSTVDLDLAKEALRRLLPRDVLFSAKESSSSIQSHELSLQAQEEGNVLPDGSIRNRIEQQMVRAIHGEHATEPGILMSLDGKELGISSLEHKLTIALTLLVFIYLPMILVILSWHFIAAQSQATPGVK